MKVGVIGVLVAWGVLCSWTLLSWFQPPEHMPENQAYADATIVSLPFLAERVLYLPDVVTACRPICPSFPWTERTLRNAVRLHQGCQLQE